MRYLSLFAGIEAATQAWHPLGWEPVGFAEIDPFPCAVLAHHYPDVPNLGSVTDITDDQIAALGPIDLVVGGSPCQDLSVAGKRAGLAGERSGLFHEQLRIFNAARHLCGARFLCWENVPGSFSSHGGRDFAVVVGSMAGTELGVPRNGWQNAGAAVGRNGLVEWRVLDAQHVRTRRFPYAVPQRRRRVFALLDTGDWRSRPPILFERESLQGNPAPRREAGEAVAGSIAACSFTGGAGGRPEGAAAGHFVPESAHALTRRYDSSEDGCGRSTPLVPEVAGCLPATGGTELKHGHGWGQQELTSGYAVPVAFGGNDTRGPIQVATACNAHGGPCGRLDFDSETFVAQLPVAFQQNTRDEVRLMNGDGQIAGALAAEPGMKQQNYIAQPVAFGADLSQKAEGIGYSCEVATCVAAGTHPGHGNHVHIAQPVAFAHQAGGTQTTLGYDPEAGTAPTLAKCQTPAVAFNPTQSEKARSMGESVEVAPTMGAGLHAAVAFDMRGREGGAMPEGPHDTANIRAASGGSSRSYVAQTMAVRRLTPVECERLMGMQDNYTRIPWRNKPAEACPDGPRYKALGNSIAVNCLEWIGERIEQVAK